MNDDSCIVPLAELHAFVVRCMEAVTVSRDHAGALADLLVAADYRGHFSHGLNRLGQYISDIETKTTAIKGAPKIIKETVATALVDGDNILGPVVGKYCIDLAMEKAKVAGIGWVSVRNTNHFGIAGWYGIRAAEKGFIGMTFANATPTLVPTHAKKAALGSNPICVAAPANNSDSFVLDMATTTVALGKVEIAERRGESIPKGWAVDESGETTTYASAATALTPLGGEAVTSGYKGYGLSMMVEVFCGILSGSNYGPNVRDWRETNSTRMSLNRGQCFVAVNPEAFADGFQNRMSDLMYICRKLDPVEGEPEVMVAGDPERKHMAKCDKQGGILYHPNQIKHAKQLAATLNVAPMKML